MIKLLDDIALLKPIAKVNPYFGSIFIAVATAVIDDPDLMSIWIECDEHGKAHTALNFKTETLQICTAKPIPGTESFIFALKMIEDGNIKHIECDEATFTALKKFLPNMKVEKAVQMVLKKPIKLEVEHEVRAEGNYDEVFELLKAGFGTGSKDEKELWYLHMVRSVIRGQATLFTLYKDGKAVSTATVRGRGENAGAITGVATLPEYRGKGYASYLTALCSNMLLDEQREPWLVPANPKVEKMYKKLGFKAEKNCYYIEINNEED